MAAKDFPMFTDGQGKRKRLTPAYCLSEAARILSHDMDHEAAMAWASLGNATAHLHDWQQVADTKARLMDSLGDKLNQALEAGGGGLQGLVRGFAIPLGNSGEEEVVNARHGSYL